MYLVGQINGVGGLMKLKRDSGRVLWYATFPYLTAASSAVEIDNENHIIGCGWYTTDSSAGVFRVDGDGSYQFFLTIAIDSTASSYVKCYGLAYEESTQLISILIQSNAGYLSYSGQADNTIAVLDSSGVIRVAQTISYKYDVSYDTTYHNNFLLKVDKYYYYAGQTTGFTT